jgi:hypothetical protein
MPEVWATPLALVLALAFAIVVVLTPVVFTATFGKPESRAAALATLRAIFRTR